MQLLSQRLLMIGGLFLLVMSLVLSGSNVSAAPLAALTPTAEPPTPTVALPTETPTPLPTATPEPTPTEEPIVPTEEPVPTAVPTEEEELKANPTISKSASSSEAKVGDSVTFTLTVRNRGDKTASDVVVRDSLSDVFDVQDVAASRGDISVNGRNIEVNIGSLAPNETVTIKIVVVVNERATPPSVSNTASLSTSSSSNNPRDDSDSVSIDILTDTTLETGSEVPVEPTPEDGADISESEVVVTEPSPVAPVSDGSQIGMPRTGSEDAPNPMLFLILGIIAISASFVLRWRNNRA
jgi:uncharacterized repeat protein (TIGR01451 family)